MTILILILSGVILLLTGVVVVAFMRLDDVHRDVVFAQDEQHDHCVRQVTKRVSDLYAAQVLTLAAADYDSPDESGNLLRISREEYEVGGPSMPALWLRDRAARLITPDEYEAETHV